MKYLFATIVVSLLLLKSSAQHCPFDGTTLVAVKFIGKDGKVMRWDKDSVYLIEVENSDAAKCTYATENIKKPLINATAFEKYYSNTGNEAYKKAIKKRLEGIKVWNDSIYIITLNQAERSCMIKKDNDFTYKSRKFAISYFNGKKQSQFSVPGNAIQSLCTNNDLKNFMPIEIKL